MPLFSFTVGNRSDIEFTDLERSMILEAKKTAEYHDGDSSMQRKASHIASLLKSSLYPIAFTGTKLILTNKFICRLLF